MPDTLTYLYGIVPADAPEPGADLAGVEGAAVRLIPAGRVAAIVSEVPGETYGDDALNARLDDLAWVGERGVSHERVLDWFAERGPVIPLSLFSLHRDVERVASRVAAEEDAYTRQLGRLQGRKEWGVKLWRREAEAVATIDELSASLQALNREIEAAPAGKRFLLEKKRGGMRTEEIRAVSRRLAHEGHAALRDRAVSAAVVPLPAAAASGERALLLHAAYLVEDDAFAAFHQAASELASRYAPGFEVELTGPWPPYHFVGSDDE